MLTPRELSLSSEEGWTPGPWHVEKICDDGLEPHLYGVCHSGTVCDSTTVCNLFSEADAHLIAVVPELYDDASEALDLILAHFGGVSDPSDVMLWSDEDAFRLYWNLHSTLSRARTPQS